MKSDISKYMMYLIYNYRYLQLLREEEITMKAEILISLGTVCR